MNDNQMIYDDNLKHFCLNLDLNLNKKGLIIYP